MLWDYIYNFYYFLHEYIFLWSLFSENGEIITNYGLYFGDFSKAENILAFLIFSPIHIIVAFLLALLNFSGLFFLLPVEKWDWFYFAVCIFWLLTFLWAKVDYIILSKISQKNLQNTEKSENFFTKTRGELFMLFYIFWRIFLPDIFIFSTIVAKICHIKFSTKTLLLLTFGVQIIRILLFIVSYLLIFSH